MTTLLPKEQLEMLRSVGDSANVLLALIFIDRLHPGHSTTVQELHGILGKDKRTIENRLKSLCTGHHAIFDGHGYVLLEGGRALILAPAPSLPDVEVLAQSPIDISVAAPSDGPEGHPQSRQEIVEAPEEDQALQIIEFWDIPEVPSIDMSIAQIVQEGEKPIHTMRVLLEEEDINLIKSESENIDSSSSRSPQNARSQPTTLQILDATNLLFGKTMSTNGIANKPRRAAIGWVAQAWDQRQHLRSPQGLIYARLIKDAFPQQQYYDHPRRYLPENYLVAIGLMAPTPAPEPEPDPEPAREPEIFEEDARAVKTWEKVLDQLKQEMHRAPFETWVKDTRAIRFDGDVLYVGTKSGYGCEWLQDRMQSTVERLLVGIMAQSVQVKFVVVQGD